MLYLKATDLKYKLQNCNPFVIKTCPIELETSIET